MESKEQGGFQLRRNGKPATVFGVKNVMRLQPDVTRIGRHTDNDFWLDSAAKNTLLSRWHAEIHCVQQDGVTRYILRDNSLNGTYVNNVRIDGTHVLEVGDNVVFGHSNGKNIQPGNVVSYREESEFSFVFESCGDDDSIIESSQPDSTVLSASPLLDQQTPTLSELRADVAVARRLLTASPTSIVLKDISNTNDASEFGIESESETEDSIPDIDVPDWCTCSNCSQLSRFSANRCCQWNGESQFDSQQLRSRLAEAGVQCITAHPGFKDCCLRIYVLEMDYHKFIKENGPFGENEDSNYVYRNLADRNYVRLMRILGIKTGEVIPACAVLRIREEFP